eukprot:229357_1
MSVEYKQRELFWQIVVVTTCFICYGLNYFTRNHIYVSSDSFKQYLVPNDENKAQQWLGTMYAVGLIGLFVSKLFISFFIDTTIKSGVKPLGFCLLFVAVITVIMALIHISHNQSLRIFICILLWTLLKACQAPQWAGVIKIISNWISYHQYGRVISIMSLSFLAGDAFTRLVYSYLLTIPFVSDNNIYSEWRIIFFFGSIITSIASIPLFVLVKDSPLERKLNLSQQNPDNAYAYCDKNDCQQKLTEITEYQSISGLNIECQHTKQIKHVERGNRCDCNQLWTLLKPLLFKPMFYFVILINLETTILREFFNMYSASYLTEIVGATKSTAALISSAFPLMGIISAPLHGIWIDRMMKKQKDVLRYLLFPVQSMINMVALITFLIYSNNDNKQANNDHISLQFATLLILLCGFSILGMYSMIYVLTLDLGGHQSPTFVTGISDCAGLIGSITMSLLSGFGDYNFMFTFLSVVSIINVITNILLVLYKWLFTYWRY